MFRLGVGRTRAARRLIGPASFALAEDCPRRGAKLVPQPGGLWIVFAVSDDLSREIEEAPAGAGELRSNFQSPARRSAADFTLVSCLTRGAICLSLAAVRLMAAALAQ